MPQPARCKLTEYSHFQAQPFSRHLSFQSWSITRVESVHGDQGPSLYMVDDNGDRHKGNVFSVRLPSSQENIFLPLGSSRHFQICHMKVWWIEYLWQFSLGNLVTIHDYYMTWSFFNGSFYLRVIHVLQQEVSTAPRALLCSQGGFGINLRLRRAGHRLQLWPDCGRGARTGFKICHSHCGMTWLFPPFGHTLFDLWWFTEVYLFV